MKMITNNSSSRSLILTILLSLTGVGIGIVSGFLAGANPKLLVLAVVAVGMVYYFFAKFEQAVLGLLILRSSLDVFSAQQVPAAFAIGLNILALVYVTVSLLTGRTIHTDGFWWFFASWVALQGLWVILLPLGGLGLDGSYLLVAMREWVRLFSWLMVYLLVMQLKGRVHPHKVIAALFISLAIPLAVALMQIILPPSLLPPFLVFETYGLFEEGSRINGTIGHPNAFATFLLFFISLTFWKIIHAYRRFLWLALVAVLVFFLASTKALVGLALLIFMICLVTISKVSLSKVIGTFLVLIIVISLFASNEFGRERLASIINTPLINPDIDISRSILLSWSDYNSFNWRIAQWNFLIQAWVNSPIFGYGLGTSSHLTIMNNYAHNDYIRALAEQGITGIIGFLIFIGGQYLRLFYKLFSLPLKSPQRNLCFVMINFLTALLLGMCTENIWSHTTLFFYWWTLFSIIGWDWNDSGTPT
jgi:hypothetical protein